MEATESRLVKPQTDRPKELMGLTGIMLADDLARVLSYLELSRITTNEEDRKFYEDQVSSYRFRLVDNLRSVYNLAVGYVLDEDKKEFEKWRTWLFTLKNALNFQELNDICDFTQKMLKNSNLTELGYKSEIKRIEETHIARNR